MNKLSVRDLDCQNKRVLIRVDFNLPLDENGRVTDETRVIAALPTIKTVLEQGGKAILISHLGRPQGKVVESMRLKPVVDVLSKHLGQKVLSVNDCIGPEVEQLVETMKPGDCALLENLRFYAEETENSLEFAKQLASLAELYVNDAFGSAHRAHASTEGVTHFFKKSAAGLLMEKELAYLGQALSEPEHPFLAIVGGAKVSGKIEVIENLLNKVDLLLIGGGMAYTFFKAKGWQIGNSLLEADKIALAKKILDKGKEKILLPLDCLIAQEMKSGAASRVVDVADIPEGWSGFDIGPKSKKLFCEKLVAAKTVVWNGPLGVFEIEDFASGTNTIAQRLSEITASGATTIIGGGDTAAAVAKAGLAKEMSHISTGGGASLEMMEGKELPGVVALTDR